MKAQLTLFFTAFIQVFFVSINTIFLASGNLLGVLAASFMISLIWTLNVRRVAIATWRERITYSLGASIGSVSGLLITNFLR